MLSLSLNTESSLARLDVGHHINVCSEYVPHLSSVRACSLALGSKDTNNLNSVTRSDIVNVLFEGHKLDMMRRLPIRDVLLVLLHLHVLLVPKGRHVVHDCEASLSLAVLALAGLLDSLSEDRGKLSMIAVDASEMGILDLGHHTAASDDDSFNLDQLVNIVRAEVSLKTGGFEVDGSDLDNCG